MLRMVDQTVYAQLYVTVQAEGIMFQKSHILQKVLSFSEPVWHSQLEENACQDEFVKSNVWTNNYNKQLTFFTHNVDRYEYNEL